MSVVTIVGAGLAGCEAAWQAAQRGLDVVLFEMRPHQTTPAHATDQFAELVCSNSLGSTRLDRALGLLKQEMRHLGSLVVAVADRCALPAGGALAVDRERFSQEITATVSGHPRITVRREECDAIPAGLAILATGPLTSQRLAQQIAGFAGQSHLYFYDALAPIVVGESIAMPPAWRQSRYDRDSGESEGDYINCPLDRSQYEAFVGAVRAGERIELRSFETNPEAERFFEGCLPIEVLAARSMEALAFGPMRPVGLRDPRTGRRPYAVVQLRQDNQAGTLYNLVGFQTNLKWPEQQRILRSIPGLEQAEFVRLGQMHRNTFINSPVLLLPTLQARSRPDLFFAGQITGTEGYVGSAAGGLWAGINAARLAHGMDALALPPVTMMGALFAYITSAEPQHFQPMKANFGLMPALDDAVRNKGDRYQAYADRALAAQAEFCANWAVI